MTKIATKTNKLNANAVAQKLNALYDARLSWENGSYKTSNEELYAILDNCLVLFTELTAERSLIKELNKLLEERGIKVTSGTSLATKVVRYVFGDCSKERSYTYARVLTVAAKEKDEKTSLCAFINARNGIEAIRKTPKDGSPSAAQKAKLAVEFAEGHFVIADALAPSFKSAVPALNPNPEAANDFAVALVRRNADNTLSIVFGSHNERLVSQVLAEAGKAAQQAEGEAAQSQQQTKSRKTRTSAVAAAAKRSRAKAKPSLKLAA
jgi:hypothetical protein